MIDRTRARADPGGATATPDMRACSRAVIVTAVLLAVYYLAPLDQPVRDPLALDPAVGLVALGAVATMQVRSVTRSRHPGLRAFKALETTVPLYLLLFASAYYLMSHDGENFNAGGLTRTDSLYFTITIFSTVGFGDITGTSQPACSDRADGPNLIVLGLGIRAFSGAVQFGRQRSGDQASQTASNPPGD